MKIKDDNIKKTEETGIDEKGKTNKKVNVKGRSKESKERA